MLLSIQPAIAEMDGPPASTFSLLTRTIPALSEPQGRLTLTQNTPVMAASATAQTTLRYDCSIGGNVPYFTGAADTLDTISSCEVTDAMVSASSAGQVVSGNVYDVWWVHRGANRICLAMSASGGGGGGWSSDTAGSNTARGTGYSQLDRTTRPYTTNKNAISNCFNGATNYGPVIANQATYLGTVYASANGQISYTFGAAGSGGVAGLMGVWNMYNRVTTSVFVTDNGTGYTYNSVTIRQARASAGNQVQFVVGVSEDTTIATTFMTATTPAVLNALCNSGLGLDNTAAYNLGSPAFVFAETALAAAGSLTASGSVYSGVGLHTISRNENNDASGNCTFITSATYQGTLTVTLRN